MPSKADFEKYRFYQCSQMPDGYYCQQVHSPGYPIEENSRLVFVPGWLPFSFMDRVLLKYKLVPRITTDD